MKIKIHYFLSVMVCAFAACNNNKNTALEKDIPSGNLLEKANWLIGKWGNKVENIEMTEIWTKESDSVYTGVSYVLRNDQKDTVSSEQIRLKNRKGNLLYIPIVKNQNDGKEVEFILTSSTEQELVFENPQHDFPQRISYRLISKDSLLAEITGINEGKESSEKFPLHRIKE